MPIYWVGLSRSHASVTTPPPPRISEPTLAVIRDTGGDELVRELFGSFSDFASAQAAWLDRLAAANAYEGILDGARVLRISAMQVGVLEVVESCQRAELAAAAHDRMAVRAALAEVHDALAAARPWVDALAAG
jgi:HPt (histidine-containing phosphotransfer) domain-containing protein